MHEIAEKGIAAHWRYKEDGALDLKSEHTFQWLRQLMEWQKELKDSLEFIDTVKLDLFSTEIYVFTPKGEIKNLPQGAMPLDFAFAIHTDLGKHCSGARVNGKIVPLNHVLQSGDSVEITSNPQRYPSKDWLKMVTSSRARAKIREYIKKEQREKSFALGKSIFEEECSKRNLKPEQILSSSLFQEYVRRKGISGDASFYTAVAYGKVAVPSLLSIIVPSSLQESEKPEGLIRRIFKKVSQRTRNFVMVSGIEDVLVTFGKCCNPVPGDPIIGFITRGRGVTLHRIECPKVSEIDPERRVNTTWNTQVEIERNAKLKVICENKMGMLANIAKKVADRKINIIRAVVTTTKDLKAIIHLDVQVKSLSDLQTVIKAVEKIKGVLSVLREI